LLRQLNERKLDFLIAPRLGSFAGERLEFEPLYEESHVIVAGANNPWVRRRRVKFARLVNEAWVLPPPDSLFGAVAKQAFENSGIDYPSSIVCTAPLEARINLLATGRFLTIVATSVLRFPARRLELKVLPVKLPFASVPVGIVTVQNRTLSPVARIFIACARELAN